MTDLDPDAAQAAIRAQADYDRAKIAEWEPAPAPPKPPRQRHVAHLADVAPADPLLMRIFGVAKLEREKRHRP